MNLGSLPESCGVEKTPPQLAPLWLTNPFPFQVFNHAGLPLHF
jgi:hypothetical protein